MGVKGGNMFLRPRMGDKYDDLRWKMYRGPFMGAYSGIITGIRSNNFFPCVNRGNGDYEIKHTRQGFHVCVSNFQAWKDLDEDYAKKRSCI